jgi:hypothetical protein
LTIAVCRSKIDIIGQILEIASNFDDIYRGKIDAVTLLKMMYKGFLPVLATNVSFLLENEMLVLRQMISSRQKDRIREQDTFDTYLWPYQVARFTNPSGTDERHSSYGFM